MKAKEKTKPVTTKKKMTGIKKTTLQHPEQKQRAAASGEIQYGHTIGRHGTDEEKNLNPEE